MTLWDVLLNDTMKRASGVEEYRVRRMIAKRKLGPEDCIRRTGQTEWIKIKDLPDSIWTDPVPTEEPKEPPAEASKPKKDRPEKKRKAPKPPPTITPAPPAPPPGEIDSDSATVPVEMVMDRPGFAADRHFEIGPQEPPSETPRRSRIIAPPVQKAKVDDDDEVLHLRRPRRVDELDLTSMVDVTFLLILFFMVTATYTLQKSLEVPPPPDESGAQQAAVIDDLRDDNIIIQVLADDTILINDRTAPLAELVGLIHREVRETGLKEVVIQAAGEAKHQTVVSVFDAANEVGVQRIRLAEAAAEPAG